MKHLIKKEKNILFGTIGWSHNGKDGQYCEAGETVKIKWQPTAGWGLQEAHYTPEGGDPVAIEDGEFVMPSANITIGATFKRFVIEDWTSKEGSFNILGSFDVKDLPTLDGFNDAGKVAFVKDTRKYATWDGYGWTYMDGKPVTPRYLTFTANEDGSSVGFIIFNDGYDLPEDYKKPNIEYSVDDGVTWQEYGLVDSDNTGDATTIDLNEGESVVFKGVNENLAYYLEDDGDYLYMKCFIEGSVAASGDVTSLLNGVGGDVTPASNCYQYMFHGCTGLTQAPALPATTLANNCYSGMFQGCTSLTQAPALPATMLVSNCYRSMFNGCTSLTSAPALPATTLADYCYSGMFSGCTSLTSAPTLPATTLVSSCYRGMFSGCTAITLHDVATLNNSANVFQDNSSCASFTIHADTPPTIDNNTINGLKADCIIYVPATSVDAYKAAQYWSARSAYIQAIQ